MSIRLITPLLGVDASSPIPPAVLKGAGAKFICRYSSRYSGGDKILTGQEYRSYEAEGIGCLAVFEDGALNATMGYAQGAQDAEFAMKQMRAAGMPAGRPMPFAVDSQVDPATCDPYFEACASVWRKQLCGPYGDKAVVSYFADKGFASPWQTYAWSAGELDARARVHQFSNDHTIGGYSVDLDHAWYDDYGQWNYDPKPPDPYNLAVLLNERFTFGNATLNELNCGVIAAAFNKGKLPNGDWQHLKLLRDRLTTEARMPGKGGWAANNKGKRWQTLNNLMKLK